MTIQEKLEAIYADIDFWLGTNIDDEDRERVAKHLLSYFQHFNEEKNETMYGVPIKMPSDFPLEFTNGVCLANSLYWNPVFVPSNLLI